VIELPTPRHRAHRRGKLLWIVLHCTAGREGPGRAIRCASYMRQSRRACSAHYVLDTRDIVRCVNDQAEAWHAGPTANMHGIGIELCGSPHQSREQWLDAQSLPMLENAALLIRNLSELHGIPLRVRTGHDLLERLPGVTTHAHVTTAFPEETTHWDPGPAFPLHELVQAAALPLVT